MIRRLVPLCLAGVLLACGGADTSLDAALPTTAAPTTADPGDGAPLRPTDTDAGSQPDTAEGSNGADVVADAPEALQFSAPLLGGGDIELTTLAGRPVLLWFWAPW